MEPTAAAYLFLLGLAGGVSLLTLTAYRHVSPAWLRWMLFAAGLFVATRYVTMALFTSPDAPQRFGWLRPCWYATSLGLPLACVIALDQLIRHPAMTPKRLLTWFSPFLAAYGAVIVFGAAVIVPDRVLGWTLHLQPAWRAALSLTHTVFTLGFIGLCILMSLKLPSRPIRIALAFLVLGQMFLGFDGLVLALGRWYFRPYLFSELVMLLALWHAYETSAAR
jgi:hypothetical protein